MTYVKKHVEYKVSDIILEQSISACKQFEVHINKTNCILKYMYVVLYELCVCITVIIVMLMPQQLKQICINICWELNILVNFQQMFCG